MSPHHAVGIFATRLCIKDLSNSLRMAGIIEAAFEPTAFDYPD